MACKWVPVWVIAGLALGGAGLARADGRLVMFSSRDCLSCRAFFQEVLPAYWTSDTSLDLPITIIDMQALGTGGNALDAPVTQMPTFVLMQDGRELSRIVGYPGREPFLAQIGEWRKLRP